MAVDCLKLTLSRISNFILWPRLVILLKIRWLFSSCLSTAQTWFPVIFFSKIEVSAGITPFWHHWYHKNEFVKEHFKLSFPGLLWKVEMPLEEVWANIVYWIFICSSSWKDRGHHNDSIIRHLKKKICDALHTLLSINYYLKITSILHMMSVLIGSKFSWEA